MANKVNDEAMHEPPSAFTGSSPGGAQFFRPQDPLRYHHHGPGLTTEEIKTINACRRDSTWKYAVPSTLFAGLATHLAVRSNILKPNPVYGSFLKVSLAAIIGNFIGRAAYIRFGNCQDKLAKLNTPIGQMARKLNEEGVRLPPHLIVAGGGGAHWSRPPWEYTFSQGWENDRGLGFGNGVRHYPAPPTPSRDWGKESQASKNAEDTSKKS